MPNLVGIGLSQVPTNSMLGGLAYQDPEHASIKDLDLRNLSQIKALTYDNAVDVFVYDTRKDSDGGAWRKKTQNTSWFNETLGTEVRGTRKEFPAVAVIVAESNPNRVTIYDGDDPDLSMWMVFKVSNSATSNFLAVSGQVLSSAAMLNGELCLGFPSSNGWGVGRISFVEDSQRWYWTSTKVYFQKANTVAERNVESSYQAGPAFDGLLNARVNDVAMTVLPNTPINPSTGLPVPTLAVGTFGGVQIIRHDESTFETGTSTAIIEKVNFTDDNGLNAIITNSGGNNQACVYVNELDTLNGLSYATYANWDGVVYQYDYSDKSLTHKALTINDVITDFVDLKNRSSAIGVQGEGRGLTLLEKSPKDAFDPDAGMVAFVASDYNTGYMHGDIKGAFLSDTDATDLSADTLNSVNTFDGTFATSTGWTANADWTISGGVATCDGQNNGRFLYPSTDRWDVGTSVVVEVTVTAYTSGTLNVSYATGAATSGTNMTATGTYKFVNDVSGNDLIYIRSESFVGSIDNVKIYYAESDRSYNNKGIIPYGTVPKTAVATGADLVAYGPFSTSNYLIQPNNTDYSFGTGDFYVTTWVYPLGTSSNYDFMLELNDSTTNNRFYLLRNPSGRVYVPWNTDVTGSEIPLNKWSCVVAQRRDGEGEVYVNGRFMISNTWASNNNLTQTGGTYFGVYSNSGGSPLYPGNLKLALMRIGAGALTSEQIEKMYDEEMHLFHENSKATLHGSSDSIKALAFDDTTNLLHVGTSAGRSEFQGLRRINNTTEAVTTAISVSNELVAEQ